MYNSDSYEEARFERLAEVVCEYFDDETGTQEAFLTDLKRALSEGKSYFVGRVLEYEKMQKVLGKVDG